MISGTGSTSGGAQVIRQIGPGGYRNFGNQSKGVTSVALPIVVSNTGNSQLVMSGAQMVGTNAADFSIDAGTTTCLLAPGSILYTGQTCYLGVKFTPAATGVRTATLNLLDNSVAGINSITLLGNGILPSPTFKITSPTNGQSFTSGTAVTFSASVTSTSGPAPTGTVQFKVDGAGYGSPVTISSGAASISVTGLTQTTHTLSATYSGDSNYAAAGPISVSITVTAAIAHPPVVVMSPMTRSNPCAPQTFNVSVSGATGMMPTGNVYLTDNNRSVSTDTLANGKAVLSSAPLLEGSHSFTTHYDGDAHNQPAASAALVIVSQAGNCSQPAGGVGAR